MSNVKMKTGNETYELRSLLFLVRNIFGFFYSIPTKKDSFKGFSNY